MKSNFLGKLLDHQIEGVKFALSNPYHLNGDEMGLGKTIQALYVACETNSKVLIVCPAYLRTNWIKEIEKFTIGLNYQVLSYTKIKDVDFDFDMLIADEAHYVKNSKAQRTKNFHNLVITKQPKRLMLLSGTPIKNRVPEFWSLLQLCHYGRQYPEFSEFLNRHYRFCNTFSHERSFQVNGITVRRFDGVKNTDRLKELIKPVYIRRKADKVLELPDTMNQSLVMKKKDKYDEQLREAYRLFDVEGDPAFMTVKAANALAKVAATVNAAQSIIDEDGKVVVFTCHKDSCREIAKKLKVKYIDGSIDPDTRYYIIEEFNNKDSGVLVATIGSASTGYNITSANRMIFNDFPFVPADLEQAKKRIHRIGQKKKCFYTYVFASDLDKKLFDMIHRKTNDIRKIYD